MLPGNLSLSALFRRAKLKRLPGPGPLDTEEAPAGAGVSSVRALKRDGYLRNSKRTFFALARAFARWLTRFFSSGVSSPKVLPRGG